MMPYPNEHACRLVQPNGNQTRRVNGDREHNGKKYDVIYQKQKNSSDWEDQAFRYPKDTWNASDARAHCKNHKGILFEPAAEEKKAMKPFAINRRWFSMKAIDNEAEISIFDEIGIWGIGVGDFKKELDALKSAKSIKLLLNSPGGNVFDGMAIYNLLIPMKEKIDVEVLGLAASISSIIALSGKSLKMDSGSYFMIHNPWSIAAGGANELRKVADTLDQIGGTMADIYTPRSNHTRREVLTLMEAETWMTAQETMDHGFANEMVEVEEIAALVCDLSKFKYQNAPKSLIEKTTNKDNPPATERDLEKYLRDGGFSKTIAAGIVSKGFSAVRAGGSDEEGAGSAPEGEEAAKPKTISPEKLRAMKARYRGLALMS